MHDYFLPLHIDGNQLKDGNSLHRRHTGMRIVYGTENRKKINSKLKISVLLSENCDTGISLFVVANSLHTRSNAKGKLATDTLAHFRW
jgi:hypothetical protein